MVYRTRREEIAKEKKQGCESKVVEDFLSGLWLLSPCRYQSPSTLTVTKAKCYCFCLRGCPKCPNLAQNFFHQKSGFVTFLYSINPNFMQKTKKTYGWKFENFCHRLTEGLTDWLMDKTDFSGQCLQIVLAYLTLWNMVGLMVRYWCSERNFIHIIKAFDPLGDLSVGFHKEKLSRPE